MANLCIGSGGTSPFCSLYDRPYPYSNTTTANYPSLIRSQSLNAAFNILEGQDYEVSYGFDMADVLSDVRGNVNLRAMLNMQPVATTSNFPGAPLSHTTQPKGRTSLFAGYTLDSWSINAQWQWFSGANKNAIVPPCAPAATTLPGYQAGDCSGATYYAVPRVKSFTQTSFTVSKRITLDNGAAMQAYFNVQNAFNSVPDDTTGSSGNPGGISTLPGQDLMGRYFTLGVRGNL